MSETLAPITCAPGYFPNSARDSLAFSIKFGVMPEDAVLIEGDSSRRIQIGSDTRPFGYAVVQRNASLKSRLNSRHRAREGISQASNQLKQRQVAVGRPTSDKMAVARGLRSRTRSK